MYGSVLVLLIVLFCINLLRTCMSMFCADVIGVLHIKKKINLLIILFHVRHLELHLDFFPYINIT